MSEEGEGGEKSFEPTQRRLDEARRRGEVPQSHDLAAAGSYLGFALAWAAFGAGSLLALGGLLQGMLAHASPLSADAFDGGGSAFGGTVLGGVALAVWPWFAAPAGIALLALLAQGSLVVAPQRIAPKLSRISPAAQLRQRLGTEGLVTFLKGCLKAALYAVVLGLTLSAHAPRLVGLAAEPWPVAVRALLEILSALVLRIAGVAVALGLVDLVWQRLSFLRRHRMTRKEVTDEAKESEGDPHLRQRRRQKGIDIAMNRMLNDVAGASVVIVNPTHYAVALKWDRAGGGAPVCVAKGVDEMAARIRERAAAAGVPIRRDPPTARAIYAGVGLGEQVARPEWRAVAAAIRFAEQMRARTRGPLR